MTLVPCSQAGCATVMAPTEANFGNGLCRGCRKYARFKRGEAAGEKTADPVRAGSNVQARIRRPGQSGAGVHSSGPAQPTASDQRTTSSRS